MNPSNKITILRNVPLFATLDEAAILQVSDLMELFHVESGQRIVTEGLEGTAFFVIVSGQVKVNLREGDSEVELADLGPGDYFGEMSLISGGPVSASVVTQTPVQLYMIERDDFQKLLETNTQFYLHFARELSFRLNRTNHDLRKRAAELARLNEGLEALVDEKTKSLRQRNEDIRSILNTINLGIITINQNLLINPEHSAFALNIFQTKALAGKEFVETILGAEDETLKSSWKNFLQRVFRQPFIAKELCTSHLPSKSLTLHLQGEGSSPIVKELEIDALPMLTSHTHGDGQELLAVMFIIKDVTETKRLQTELKAKEEDLSESVGAILGIIQGDRELFGDFLQEVEEHLHYLEEQFNRPDLFMRNDTLAELRRRVHTIKGNAGIFKLTRMTNIAHKMEDLFEELQHGSLAPTPPNLAILGTNLKELVRLFHTARGYLININTEVSEESGIFGLSEQDLSVRIPLAQLSRLSGLVESATQRFNQDQTLTELHRQFIQLRRVPASQLFRRFPGLVDDLAVQIGKQVYFDTKGGEILIDRLVAERLGEPMVHLIRNALDHGLETLDERIHAGKSPQGRLTLSVVDRGDTLEILLEDDGRGINIEAVKRSAIQKGLITEAQAESLNKEETIRLLFTPGFSTKTEVTENSGRGIGLDAIANAVRSLKGRISIASEESKGTRFRIFLPKVM